MKVPIKASELSKSPISIVTSSFDTLLFKTIETNALSTAESSIWKLPTSSSDFSALPPIDNICPLDVKVFELCVMSL